MEERTFETMYPLVDQTFERVPQVKQFYSDGLTTYKELVYRAGRKSATHQAVENISQTYTVEGTNADLRCYVPPLDRRGRCFRRHLDKFRTLMRFFVTCYNLSCVARLKHPNRPTHPSDFLPTLF